MFKCPFEIYSSPLPWEEYGIILEIPNYCTEEELRMVSEILRKKHHNLLLISILTYVKTLEVVPYVLRVNGYLITDTLIYDFMVDNLPSAEYRFDAVHEGYDIRVSS